MSKEELTRGERIALRVSVAQTVLAVVGFFVALVALYAALNEADAVRKQQQAVVWPFVEVFLSNNDVAGDEFIEVRAQNKGIGPARIRRVDLFLDGQPQSDWSSAIAATAEVGDRALVLSHENLSGRVMAAGEIIRMVRIDQFALPQGDGGFDYLELLGRIRSATDAGRLHIEACYCSVFDDCWRMNTVQYGEVEPVSACSGQADDVTL